MLFRLRHVPSVGPGDARKARQGSLPSGPRWRGRGVPGGLPPPGRPGVKVRVLVRLKPGILDVQGAAVKRALAGLGFAEVTDLRVGKVIDVELGAATAEDGDRKSVV